MILADAADAIRDWKPTRWWEWAAIVVFLLIVAVGAYGLGKDIKRKLR